MATNKREVRLQKILKFLNNNGGVSVREVATAFNVADITARRDLYELKDRQLIQYVSGVAIANPDAATSDNIRIKPYELCSEKQVNYDKKVKIGRLASTLLEPGDNIIIDTGSTTEQFAQQIPSDIPLTALCYNFNILKEMHHRKQVKLISTGGVYHRNTEMFESPEGISLINRTRASKVFLSAAGISEQLGITCVNQYEVPVKAAIIKASLLRILLIDSSKFDVVHSAYFAPLSAVDIIITDKGIPNAWIEILQERNIRLMIAK